MIAGTQRTFYTIAIVSIFLGGLAAGAIMLPIANANIGEIQASSQVAGAPNVSYIIRHNVSLNNSKQLHSIVVHLQSAIVSHVGPDDVKIRINGINKTRILTQEQIFHASNGSVRFVLKEAIMVHNGAMLQITIADIENPLQDIYVNTLLSNASDSGAITNNMFIWATFRSYINIKNPIEYSDLRINETTITKNEPIMVSATVYNTATVRSRYNATLHVNGHVINSKQGTIKPTQTKTISFVISFNATGRHTLSIGSASPIIVPVQQDSGGSNETFSYVTIEQEIDVVINTTKDVSKIKIKVKGPKKTRIYVNNSIVPSGKGSPVRIYRDIDVSPNIDGDIETFKIKVKGPKKTFISGLGTNTSLTPNAPFIVLEQDIDVIINTTADIEKVKVKVKRTKKTFLYINNSTIRTDEKVTFIKISQDIDVISESSGDLGKLKVKVKGPKKTKVILQNSTVIQNTQSLNSNTAEMRAPQTYISFPQIERSFIGGMTIGAVLTGAFVLSRNIL
ncbi:MAG: hypothetical protein ABEI06_08705 [Halobacteriaceae archaeon]